MNRFDTFVSQIHLFENLQNLTGYFLSYHIRFTTQDKPVHNFLKLVLKNAISFKKYQFLFYKTRSLGQERAKRPFSHLDASWKGKIYATFCIVRERNKREKSGEREAIVRIKWNVKWNFFQPEKLSTRAHKSALSTLAILLAAADNEMWTFFSLSFTLWRAKIKRV